MSVAVVVAKRPKPTAAVSITPMSRRAAVLRDHLIEVVVRLSEDKTNPEQVAVVVRQALGAFPSAVSGPGRRSIDASVVWPGRPPEGQVEQLRRALADAGYRVVIREKRECAEPGCATGLMVDWNRLSWVPPGWFTSLICGTHQYRQCSSCNSTYRMSSTNSVEAAPSLHCQVCGGMMVEWGGSKVWQAELVTARP